MLEHRLTPELIPRTQKNHIFLYTLFINIHTFSIISSDIKRLQTAFRYGAL